MAINYYRLKIFYFRALKIITRQLSVNLTGPEFFGVQANYTNELKFTNNESYKSIPIYQVLSTTKNNSIDFPVKLEKETLLKMYHDMISIATMDKILYESQRQGRISFYMTNNGEEAIQIGSAAALTLQDIIYAQYREAGVLLYRGYKYSQFLNQCYSNYEDPAKGRQMPVHYGSKELNFVTISSPLTVQLPQAVGAAYALKLGKKKVCIACYFGEGAASEGDAHAAFNFAATLECPIIFICRNNGYAISTPTSEQYKGDGIGARGPAYGINTIRVDGNDILAMYNATKIARDFCIDNGKPVLIEAMTYRISHHSTSDDSTAYRSLDEIEEWNKQSPVLKFRKYLEEIGIWNDEQEVELQKSTLKKFLADFAEAEKKLKPQWKEMFTDVYHEMPQHIKHQMLTMDNHLKEYGEHYPVKDHEYNEHDNIINTK
ncbi:hypothetical protein PV328_002208 [Microctonus aethiopoides]|uniref:2-oxoisovalerate dehydrogenase subunit alpha n=1 Tax=Microctonus aethiopoides TaxID=144406 RepID=A0AA39FZ18_9HYME|nr:hypothetical protein PV328_002208 [Microctonus aethiopoides]